MRILLDLASVDAQTIRYVVPEAYAGMQIKSIEFTVVAGAVFAETPNVVLTDAEGHTVQNALPTDALPIAAVGNYNYGNYGTYRFVAAVNDFWVPFPSVTIEADDLLEILLTDGGFSSALLVIE